MWLLLLCLNKVVDNFDSLMSTSSSLHIQVGSEEPELARQAASRRSLAQIGTSNGTPSSGASEGVAEQVCPANHSLFSVVLLVGLFKEAPGWR